MTQPIDTGMIWVMLTISGALPILVNQIERPFAISLSKCDVPVNSTEYTGSRWCGDRLEVINYGNELSSMGQTQENLCKVSMIILSGFLADVWGRKALLLVGSCLVSMSVALFILATMIPSWARVLYVLGQGCQGMSAMEFIPVVVAGDLAARKDADSTSVFRMNDMYRMMSQLACTIIGGVIIGLQLTDYAGVWLLMLSILLCNIVFIVLRFPETMSEETRKTIGNSSLGSELAAWRYVFTNFEGLPLMTLDSFLCGPMYAMISGIVPVAMAFRGLSQRAIFCITFPIMLLYPHINKLVSGFFIGKFGYARAWDMIHWYRLMLLPIISSLVSEYTIFLGLWYVAFATCLGLMAMKQAIRLQYVGERYNAKALAINQATVFCSGALTASISGAFFDARATTYFGRSLTLNAANACLFLGFLVYHFGHRKISLRVCDEIQKKMDEQKKKAD